MSVDGQSANESVDDFAERVVSGANAAFEVSREADAEFNKALRIFLDLSAAKAGVSSCGRSPWFDFVDELVADGLVPGDLSVGQRQIVSWFVWLGGWVYGVGEFPKYLEYWLYYCVPDHCENMNIVEWLALDSCEDIREPLSVVGSLIPELLLRGFELDSAAMQDD